MNTVACRGVTPSTPCGMTGTALQMNFSENFIKIRRCTDEEANIYINSIRD
jgi:hypothetical protein